MNVILKISVPDFEELKKVLAQLAEIKKEHSDNCTLSVEIEIL